MPSMALSCRIDAGSQTADEIQQAIRQLGNDSTALGKMKAASWVDSPAARACVYTVLYLNFRDAHALHIDLNKLRGKGLSIVCTLFRSTPAPDGFISSIASIFDLQFCFFIVMKGFQVSIDDYRPGPGFSRTLNIRTAWLCPHEDS
ncbi:hypothetical protein CSPAE12_05799 [Colletotrichum incanum]|nr:hypothetical protein CSPAE12_05799 [Colletotrichum incanum]